MAADACGGGGTIAVYGAVADSIGRIRLPFFAFIHELHRSAPVDHLLFEKNPCVKVLTLSRRPLNTDIRAYTLGHWPLILVPGRILSYLYIVTSRPYILSFLPKCIFFVGYLHCFALVACHLPAAAVIHLLLCARLRYLVIPHAISHVCQLEYALLCLLLLSICFFVQVSTRVTDNGSRLDAWSKPTKMTATRAIIWAKKLDLKKLASDKYSLLSLSAKIVAPFVYMHNFLSIGHFDIKPSNILFEINHA